MHQISENYRLRKSYLENNEVPTQSVMKEKMRPALASVVFKSLSPSLKILAGIQPPLKGGGSDWYVPPEELLASRAVLKPIKRECNKKIGYNGMCSIGQTLHQRHHRGMLEERNRALKENDEGWKKAILASNRGYYDYSSKQCAKHNTHRILKANHEFEVLFSTSLTKIKELMFCATQKEIERMRGDIYQQMNERCAQLVKNQAATLYDEYEQKLNMEKTRMKTEFTEAVENIWTSTANQVHDVNVEKHTTVEKLRHFLECQNLATQVYVALKEREECEKEIDQSKHQHEKNLKLLKEEIAVKDFEVRLAIEQILKCQRLKLIWRKKICHVVKKFQLFVEYCLKALPQHAEFFCNMEKLMLLQLNEALENPIAESIIEYESDSEEIVPKPHPFYLFCDKGDKPHIDRSLCPKHCTSSASQLPVVVINKRFVYSACDNFEVFSDKVNEYVYGNRGDDADLQDDHNYKLNIHVKITTQEQLAEVKLESSWLQVLQNEIPNTKNLPLECCVCKIPYCFCSSLDASEMSPTYPLPTKEHTPEELDQGNKIDTRGAELRLQREPKWESYMNFVKPKKCCCPLMAKKHLHENMPVYMKNVSRYDFPEIPNYETCDAETLKALINTARGKRTTASKKKEVRAMKDAMTQYTDVEYDHLCTCFSDDEISMLVEALAKGLPIFELDKTHNEGKSVDVCTSYLGKTASSFATERAYSLRNLLADAPDLEEMFRNSKCDYNLNDFS